MTSVRTASGALAAAAATVAAVDLTLTQIGMPHWLVLGVLDESAHLATAALLVGGALVVARPPFVLGVAVGAVAIDIDHLPLVAGAHQITAGTPRPVSHSLAVLLAILALAAVPTRARLVLIGVAAGLATHLVRDMATGGLPLLWPLATTTVTIPYAAYLAVVAAGALVAVLAVLWGRRRESRAPAAMAR